MCLDLCIFFNNHSLKSRWIVEDVYWAAKQQGEYPGVDKKIIDIRNQSITMKLHCSREKFIIDCYWLINMITIDSNQCNSW